MAAIRESSVQHCRLMCQGGACRETCGAVRPFLAAVKGSALLADSSGILGQANQAHLQGSPPTASRPPEAARAPSRWKASA